MSGSFWRIVREVIEESDILLEVLDARFIDETRNKELEQKIFESKKALIFVINKCDLGNKATLEREKKKLKNAVFVSAKDHLGTLILYKKILAVANARFPEKEKIIIGVAGYPNTGKSSVINALKGKHSALTSSVSGFTRAKQLIKLAHNIYLMDTPGVLAYDDKDELKLALTGSLDVSKLKDVEGTALQVLEGYPEIAEQLHVEGDAETMLEEIARRWNLLLKGNKPNTIEAAKRLVLDIQKGKITLRP